MHKNFLWQGFLIVVLAGTLWYSGLALYRYYIYKGLSTQASVLTMQWEINEAASDKFIVEALYKFTVADKTYVGETAWDDRPYLNDWAAREVITEKAKQTWRAWYDPSNPNHSSLKRDFPLKETLSAICLWGLFFYFILLGLYVTKYRS
jgi:hypothetical protein